MEMQQPTAVSESVGGPLPVVVKSSSCENIRTQDRIMTGEFRVSVLVSVLLKQCAKKTFFQKREAFTFWLAAVSKISCVGDAESRKECVHNHHRQQLSHLLTPLIINDRENEGFSPMERIATNKKHNSATRKKKSAQPEPFKFLIKFSCVRRDFLLDESLQEKIKVCLAKALQISDTRVRLSFDYSHKDPHQRRFIISTNVSITKPRKREFPLLSWFTTSLEAVPAFIISLESSDSVLHRSNIQGQTIETDLFAPPVARKISSPCSLTPEHAFPLHSPLLDQKVKRSITMQQRSQWNNFEPSFKYSPSYKVVTHVDNSKFQRWFVTATSSLYVLLFNRVRRQFFKRWIEFSKLRHVFDRWLWFQLINAKAKLGLYRILRLYKRHFEYQSFKKWAFKQIFWELTLGKMPKVPEGTYKINVKANGYEEHTEMCINYRADTDQGRTMKIFLNPENTLKVGQVRVVLSWGKSPSDLDLHCKDKKGHHIYYGQKEDDDGRLQLDIDVTNGFGPETLTLHPREGEVYWVYVHKYSDDGDVAESEAKVQVYGLPGIDRITLPASASKSQKYWHVFKLYGKKDFDIVNELAQAEPTDWSNEAQSRATGFPAIITDLETSQEKRFGNVSGHPDNISLLGYTLEASQGRAIGTVLGPSLIDGQPVLFLPTLQGTLAAELRSQLSRAKFSVLCTDILGDRLTDLISEAIAVLVNEHICINFRVRIDANNSDAVFRMKNYGQKVVRISTANDQLIGDFQVEVLPQHAIRLPNRIEYFNALTNTLIPTTTVTAELVLCEPKETVVTKLLTTSPC